MAEGTIVLINSLIVTVTLIGVTLNGFAMGLAIGDYAVLRDREVNGASGVVAIGAMRRKAVRWALQFGLLVTVLYSWNIDLGEMAVGFRIYSALFLMVDAMLDVKDRRHLHRLLLEYAQLQTQTQPPSDVVVPAAQTPRPGTKRGRQLSEEQIKPEKS